MRSEREKIAAIRTSNNEPAAHEIDIHCFIVYIDYCSNLHYHPYDLAGIKIVFKIYQQISIEYDIPKLLIY